MSYQRLILHYGFDPEEFLGILSEEAIEGCWFELNRLGGCGAGELRLDRSFGNRNAILPGHWIALEYAAGERWYLGRVEEIEANSPAGIRVRLEGPAIELNEVFPGSFQAESGGFKPHRYGRTDLFAHDPDYDIESNDYVVNSAALVDKLLSQYVANQTHIIYDSTLVETGSLAEDVTSMKFRGEESVRTILKDLALRAGNATWGVDAERRFFFRQPTGDLLKTYAEGTSVTRLSMSRSREMLFNRVMLTGDYVYDRRDYSSQVARRSYRWRANYRQPESIANYGEKRIRIEVPWIRTREDSRAFVQEFFRVYADPPARYEIETIPQESLPLPWEGEIRLDDQQGNEMVRGPAERIRVQFDHAPRFRMELGPGDPRELWPESTQDERWELPEDRSGYGGSEVTLTDSSEPSSGNGSGETSETSASSASSSSEQIASSGETSEFSSVESLDSIDSSLASSLDSMSSSVFETSSMAVTSDSGSLSESETPGSSSLSESQPNDESSAQTGSSSFGGSSEVASSSVSEGSSSAESSVSSSIGSESGSDAASSEASSSENESSGNSSGSSEVHSSSGSGGSSSGSGGASGSGGGNSSEGGQSSGTNASGSGGSGSEPPGSSAEPSSSFVSSGGTSEEWSSGESLSDDPSGIYSEASS